MAATARISVNVGVAIPDRTGITACTVVARNKIVRRDLCIHGGVPYEGKLECPTEVFSRPRAAHTPGLDQGSPYWFL